MTLKIESAIAKLPRNSRRELLKMWQELFGRPVTGIRRELLIPCLAYRLQEQAYGGSTPEQELELRRANLMYKKSFHPGSRAGLQLGTCIRRQWRNEMHEVVATQRGYEYRGVCYKSLSAIARQITHTRWSGPAFFGLTRSCRSEKSA